MRKFNNRIIEKFDSKIEVPSFSKISNKINYPTHEPVQTKYRWLSPSLGILFSIIAVSCLTIFTSNNIIGSGNTHIDKPTEKLSLLSWDKDVDFIGNEIYYDLPMVYNSCDLTELLNFSVNSWDVYDGTTLVNKEHVPLSFGVNDFTIELSRFNEEPVEYNIIVNVGSSKQEYISNIDEYKAYTYLENEEVSLVINSYEEFNNFLQTSNYSLPNASDYDETYFYSKALILKTSKAQLSDIRMIVKNDTLYISSISKETPTNTLYIFEINEELKNTFSSFIYQSFEEYLENTIKAK